MATCRSITRLFVLRRSGCGHRFFVLDQRFPPILLLGIALVLVSAFCLQSRPGTRLLSDPLTLAFATIAMLTSAVYSIADAVAVQHVPAEVVFFWQCTIALPIYVALALARQRLLGGPGQLRSQGVGGTDSGSISSLARSPMCPTC